MLATALADDGQDGNRTRERLRREDLVAPALIDVEVASMLRRTARSGQLGDRRARLALADLAALPLRRAAHQPLLDRIWDLRANITAHDAAYVALAEDLDVPLLTADRRLADATGPRCAIEIIKT